MYSYIEVMFSVAAAAEGWKRGFFHGAGCAYVAEVFLVLGNDAAVDFGGGVWAENAILDAVPDPQY